MLSRRAIPLLGMFNAISVFTQRRSGHKQKGTSIGKIGAADRTHLSAETTYIAISRDAPRLKTRNMGKLLSCLRCLCDAWWCQSGSPGSRGGALRRVASGPRLYLSFSTHFPYHLFKRKYVLCLVCLFVTQGSFFKLFSFFLRPSGALAQLPPLGLSYHLPRLSSKVIASITAVPQGSAFCFCSLETVFLELLYLLLQSLQLLYAQKYGDVSTMPPEIK